MPECDGPTCTKMIRDLLKNECGIPREKQSMICMMSAYQSKTYFDIALQAGVDYYYPKPVENERL